MSVKKIMEANAVAIAATSIIAKVNPKSPSGLNQMNHPTSTMVGKDLGSTGGPHYAQSQNKHAFILWKDTREPRLRSPAKGHVATQTIIYRDDRN